MAENLQSVRFDVVAVARELGPRLAARAAAHDQEDSFVADNYAEFKRARLFSAAVPAELGGGGATHRELCGMLLELARHCGSSALALSMHTHLVATSVCKWRHGVQAVEPLLRRVAHEELVLVTSGGSDWLDGSGVAEQVEGGFRITSRKCFVSGAPSGDLLLTGAVYDDPVEGPTVVHVPVPMKAPGVKVLDNWRTLGMRGTGSSDVMLEGVVVPAEAVALRRPRGKWHPFFNLLNPVVWPLVGAVYAGVAEQARSLAVAQAARRRDDPVVQGLVGEMDAQLTAVRIAHGELMALCNDYDFEPSLDRANRVFLVKTLLVRACLATVEKAIEVSGGGSYFRSAGLERLFRDVQAARFHPLQEKRAALFSGRVALGLEPV